MVAILWLSKMQYLAVEVFSSRNRRPGGKLYVSGRVEGGQGNGAVLNAMVIGVWSWSVQTLLSKHGGFAMGVREKPGEATE